MAACAGTAGAAGEAKACCTGTAPQPTCEVAGAGEQFYSTVREANNTLLVIVLTQNSTLGNCQNCR